MQSMITVIVVTHSSKHDNTESQVWLTILIFKANNSDICLMWWGSYIDPMGENKTWPWMPFGPKSLYKGDRLRAFWLKIKAFKVNWPRLLLLITVKVSEEKWKKYLRLECNINGERQVPRLTTQEIGPYGKKRKKEKERDKKEGKGGKDRGA